MDTLSDINNFMETETESSQELIQVTDSSLLANEQIKLQLNESLESPLTSYLRSSADHDPQKIIPGRSSRENNVEVSLSSDSINNEFKATAMTTEDGNTLVIPADELAQMLSLGQVEGLEFEQVNVGEETGTKSRMARLVPVPCSKDSYYLSYEDPELEKTETAKQSSETETAKEPDTDALVYNNSPEAEQESPETKADLEDVQQTLMKDSIIDDGSAYITDPKPEEDKVVQSQSQPLDEPSVLNTTEELANKEIKVEKEEPSEKPTLKRKPKKVTVIPPLPESVSFKEKVDFLSQHHNKLCQNYLVTKGIKRFSGAWKKPPKDDTLLKTRLAVLKEIEQDFKQLCHTCFEETHGVGESCPLLSPQWIIPNVEGGRLKLQTPDEILFGMSRVYPGLQSLFARDELPAYTQFGPLKGRLVSMADLASMGVVKNDVDVSNLWPLPVVDGLHEFDLENFVYVKYLKETNWLKLIQVAPAREENYPHNVQTVYKNGHIYFVTTRDIEPGGELFLRAMEPPYRVYYNMHRLGEVDYNFCSRGKCKPEHPTPENRHLKLHHLVNFVRHQLLVHTPQYGVFSWAAIYNCQQCGEDCFDKETYVKHSQQQHGDTKTRKAANVCRFCHLKCNSKNILYHHIRLQHPKEPHLNMFCCEICGKRFKNRDYLRHHHKSSHETEPTSCKLCDKLFQNPTKVRHHMRKVHLRPDQMKVCSICGAIYKDSWALKIHMKKHTQPFQKVATHRRSSKAVGTTVTQEMLQSQQQQQMMSVKVVHDEGGMSEPSVFVSYVDNLPEQQLITFRTGNGVVQTLLQ